MLSAYLARCVLIVTVIWRSDHWDSTRKNMRRLCDLKDQIRGNIWVFHQPSLGFGNIFNQPSLGFDMFWLDFRKISRRWSFVSHEDHHFPPSCSLISCCDRIGWCTVSATAQLKPPKGLSNHPMVGWIWSGFSFSFSPRPWFLSTFYCPFKAILFHPFPSNRQGLFSSRPSGPKKWWAPLRVDIHRFESPHDSSPNSRMDQTLPGWIRHPNPSKSNQTTWLSARDLMKGGTSSKCVRLETNKHGNHQPALGWITNRVRQVWISELVQKKCWIYVQNCYPNE